MDLSSNLLNGSLPSEIRTVRYLNLSSNRFSGPIPPEIGRSIPQNATLDLSYNNFSGPVPEVGAFLNQKPQCFFENPGLCGGPLKSLCSVPVTLSNLPPNTTMSPSTIAVIPESLPEQPTENGSPQPEKPQQRRDGLTLGTIAGIIVGNFTALSLVSMVFIYRYQVKRKKADAATVVEIFGDRKKNEDAGRWSCLRASWKGRGNDDGVSNSSSSISESEEEPRDQKLGHLVLVDVEPSELELERLLKASAYILGTSGTSIVYNTIASSLQQFHLF